jgi:23S rRNA pseudouridine1911/1915/1917 synthase
MNHSKANPIIWTWVTPSNQERADVAIFEALEKQEGRSDLPTPKLSRSQIKRLIEEGQITSNGVALKANSRIKQGIEIRVEFPPPKPTTLVPENRPIEILFEDQHLLVVNKPQGLTVHPSPSQMEGTLVHILLHHIKDLSGIGGTLRPGIVHRIDKDTSGALVITKTDAAHIKLTETFSSHSIDRVYWALCYGAPPFSKTPTRIESLIGRSPNDRKKMSMQVKEGRKAVTYFSTQKAFAVSSKKPFASWLEVTLETGRTHQVRVHLTGLGYSILGDPVYGKPSTQHPKWLSLPTDIRSAVLDLPGQALHARVLGFEHPITREKLRFEAEPPPQFNQLLRACHAYDIGN